MYSFGNDHNPYGNDRSRFENPEAFEARMEADYLAMSQRERDQEEARLDWLDSMREEQD
jgi:hypothetical protein